MNELMVLYVKWIEVDRDTKDTEKAFKEMEKYIAGELSLKEEQCSKLEGLIMDCAAETQSQGFVGGFKTAMRLCMEGMNVET